MGTGATTWAPGLTVEQAYHMDVKMDDGYPQSGKIQAIYTYNAQACWAAGGGGAHNAKFGATQWPSNAPSTAATAYSATNCYDNGGCGCKNKVILYRMPFLLTVLLSFQFQ